MTDFNRIMASYESIHRSPANRALHAIGIPMIAIWERPGEWCK